MLQDHYITSGQLTVGASASDIASALQATAAKIPSNLITCYYFSVTKQTAKNYIQWDVTFNTDYSLPQTLIQVIGNGLQGTVLSKYIILTVFVYLRRYLVSKSNLSIFAGFLQGSSQLIQSLNFKSIQ